LNRKTALFFIGVFILSTTLFWYRADLLLWIIPLITLIWWSYTNQDTHFQKLQVSFFAIILAFANLTVHEFINKKPSLKNDTPICFKAEVLETPQLKSFQTHEFLAENPTFGKIKIISKPNSTIPSMGQQIYVCGKYKLPSQKQKNNFSEAVYFRSQNIKAKFTSAEIFKSQISMSVHGQFLNLLSDIQKKLLNVHKALLNKQNASLMEAMLVGRGSPDRLDSEIWTLGQNLGVAHIFAASALNMSTLIIFCGYFLYLFKAKKFTTFLALELVITLYAFVTCWIPSMSRAWFIATFVLAGRAFSKEPNLLTILLLAGFISLLVDPNLIADIGFQFSYLSTLGIVLWTERLTESMKFLPRSWAAPLAVTFCGISLVLPIQLFYFGNVALYAPLANLLAVPLGNLILIFGLIVSLLSNLGPIGWLLCSGFELIASLLIDLFKLWLTSLSFLPGAFLKINGFNFWNVLWLYGVVFWIVCNKNKIALHALIASGLLMLVLPLIAGGETLKIQSISKREFTGWLIQKGTQKVFICKSFTQYPQNRIESTFKKLGVTQLDYNIGDCKMPPALSVRNTLTLTTEEEINVNDIKIKTGKTGVLIIYKNFSGLFLLKHSSIDDSQGFFSMVQFAYPNKSIRKNNWTASSKSEYCMLPWTDKASREFIENKLQDKCKKVLSHMKLKDCVLETDGNYIKGDCFQ
jgi:ComEC/Rec2-related protein